MATPDFEAFASWSPKRQPAPVNPNIGASGFSAEGASLRDANMGPKTPPGWAASQAETSLRPNSLGRVMSSGSALFDAGASAGNAMKDGAGKVSSGIFEAGRGVSKMALNAVKPALGVAGSVAGALPHAAAYGDDAIPRWDKARLAGADALRAGSTAIGGILGAGAGSVIPVAGTIAGGVAGAAAGDWAGHKLGNTIFGSDDILRKSGRDPNRNIIDAAMNKDGQGFFGGGPDGKGPTPTAGGLPVQATAGGLPIQTSAGQADAMRFRSAKYPGAPNAEQAGGSPAQPNPEQTPATALRGQSGADMGGGISKLVQDGKTLFSNVQGGDNDALMGRAPTSAQNQRAMDGIQLRQDQGDAAYAANRQYAAEVADAQALRKGPTYINSFKAQTERRSQDMNREVTLRGQDIMREGHFLTNDVAKANARYQMNKDKRDFDISRSDYANTRDDKAFEQRQSATKALHEEIGNMLPPGADGKPDLATAARYATGLTAHVAGVADQYRKRASAEPNNPKAKDWLDTAAHLDKQGPASLDATAKQRLMAGMLAKDTETANHSSLNPFGGTAVQTNAPVASLKLKPGVFSDDYIATHTDGSKGVIPRRKIDGGWFEPANASYDSLKVK